MNHPLRIFLPFLLCLWSVFAIGAPQSVRWTGSEDKSAELAHILSVVKAKTGVALAESGLVKIEDRPLATSHFTHWAVMAGTLPMKGMGIRLWKSLKDGAAIQVEARVDTPPSPQSVAALQRSAVVDSRDGLQTVKSIVRRHLDDREIRGVRSTEYWEHGTIVREVTVKSRHGKHVVRLSPIDGRVLSAEYEEFPQSSRGGTAEFSLPVQVYPIYEEVEGEPGTILPRVASELKYLNRRIPRGEGDIYASLKTQRYYYDKHDPVLGLTEEGRKQGFWSMSFIKARAGEILEKLPLGDNDFAVGAVLDGRYATVNLNPAAPEKFKDLTFKPRSAANFMPLWRSAPEDPDADEMVPSSTVLGKPLTSAEEVASRPARRLPNHDAVAYLNDGFDELQVYWSINQMFDSLRPMGFVDPELSTRRFHAFLYDPDIAYRDNAYYTDDTIHFTTYSANAPNMARDNTTIWHELGHGVMDRMMGDLLKLADTGGLSEGMADFVAQLVVNDVADPKGFPGKDKMRIVNRTGFNLTNEVHDDGEAYGGAMNDMLEAAIGAYGRAGLTKVADLTLDAMRFARNHPGLTANDWFDRMLFADSLGNGSVRQPGELREFILQALQGRNFNRDGSPAAEFGFNNAGVEVNSGAPGSRQKPIKVELTAEASRKFEVDVRLKSSPGYAFRYPVAVKVQYRGGPIQGAANWEGEEAGAIDYKLASESDTLRLPLTVRGKCDEVNRPDNSCVDFAYVQVFNAGDQAKPVAKKRFYVRVYPKSR